MKTTWTAEEMFLRPGRGFATDPFEEYPERFTPEFRAFVEQESWDYASEVKLKFPEELRRGVGLGEVICPFCGGSLMFGAQHIGKLSRLRMIRYEDCQCRRWIRFWTAWKEVPDRFADADLDTMQPQATMSISLERQQEILEVLKANPDDSYFLYGPVGSGKTHFVTALYRIALGKALKNQFSQGLHHCTSVWRISALRLLRENTDWNQRDRNDPNLQIPAPTLMASMIERAKKTYGQHPCLFLDELDKVAMTDAKAAVLCEIVDEVYKHNGQLVTTSNFGYDQLIAKWGRENAGTVVRRFGIGERQHSILFSDQRPAPGMTPGNTRTDRLASFRAAVDDTENDTGLVLPDTDRSTAVHSATKVGPPISLPAKGTQIDGTAKRGAVVRDSMR